MDQTTAQQVYDLLIEHCGAHPDDKGQFVQAHVRSHVEEFRFMGDLGFGGKFWRDPDPQHGERWRVTCYREDETPERVKAIEDTNGALSLLQTTLTDL